jgi:V-type H+-transporting ATPase subunit H
MDSKSSEQIINYASLFSLFPKEKATYSSYRPTLDKYEQDGVLEKNSAKVISDLLAMSIDSQKEALDERQNSQQYIRILFEIINKVHGDEKLITFALLYIDGMLEENRNRIENFIAIQKSFNPNTKKDLIGILLNFLISNNDPKNYNRNTASRVLSMLIEATGFEPCKDHALDFMNSIYNFDSSRISANAYTYSIMYLCKINELAREFVELNGVNKLIEMLDHECLSDYQIAYNVLVTFWVFSYHDFAAKSFESPTLDLIEKCLKILDFFNKEKVVRVTLLLIENLWTNKKCLEILSDLNGLELICKLQQRHWVDEDIKDLLEKLWEKFDQNYEEFTSIDKFRKEIHLKSLRWGPVHTERFWQENFIHFHDKDNLDLIKELVELLNVENERTIAVALYDLGEFAKYFPFGRSYLDNLGIKQVIYDVMQKSDSAEIKKEAITCLQKLIVTSWQGKSKN